MRHAIIAVFLLAALAGTAVAGPFEDAFSAHERGDYATALREFRVLAAQDHAIAQNNLGFMYGKGEGVPQDYAEAVKWYRLAAEQGYDKAQFNLGNLYRKGEGAPQDYAEAVKWYRKAAEQGVVEAQFAVGVMYGSASCVPQDYVRSHMWFTIAGAQGDEQAAKNRGLIAQLMTPAQIAEAQKLAREWKPK